MTFFFAALPFVGLLLVMWILYTRKRKDRQYWDAAFRDSIRRPPGESLRKMMLDLDEDYMVQASELCILGSVQSLS
ncbi:MAG: hypothetical protein E1N59_1905 [Puniceicoccaceae bacterium 5H]|nr:MAG: hypothetical protein E1N59_1905 [Puniceicoccaceae bacterium 5H]